MSWRCADVRRARCRILLCGPRLRDLPLDDRVHGCDAVPSDPRKKNGFAFCGAETLALISPRTRLDHINSPANPTGGITPKAEIDALVPGSPGKVPEVAMAVRRDARHHDLGGALTSRSLRCRRSAAADLLDGRPDLRHDRLAPRAGRSGRATLRDAARKLAVNSHSCVNAATQWAGVAALKGRRIASREMMAASRYAPELVIEGLNQLRAFPASSPRAPYAFQRFQSGWKARTGLGPS